MTSIFQVKPRLPECFIEAVQYTGQNGPEVMQFIVGADDEPLDSNPWFCLNRYDEKELGISYSSGEYVPVKPGTWILQFPHDESSMPVNIMVSEQDMKNYWSTVRQSGSIAPEKLQKPPVHRTVTDLTDDDIREFASTWIGNDDPNERIWAIIRDTKRDCIGFLVSREKDGFVNGEYIDVELFGDGDIQSSDSQFEEEKHHAAWVRFLKEHGVEEGIKDVE